MGLMRFSKRDACETEVRALHRRGLTLREIASNVGVSAKSVRNWLAVWGLPTKGTKRDRCETEVKALYAMGISLIEIGWRVQVNKNTVSRWLHQWDLIENRVRSKPRSWRAKIRDRMLYEQG